jgi:hypothetical protein
MSHEKNLINSTACAALVTIVAPEDIWFCTVDTTIDITDQRGITL